MRTLKMFLLCCAFAAPAMAESASTTPTEQIQLIQRAVSGDFEALAALDTDEEASRWDLFLQGYALASSDRDQEAVEAWEQAVGMGLHLAVKALASHHYERRNWMEAYAWARLAMEVDAALHDSNMDDLRGRWPLYTAVQAADNLESEQHQAAGPLAVEGVNRYLQHLISTDDVGSEDRNDVKDLEIVERTRPVFPRSMLENGRPGWSYVQFEIRPDGRVGEVAAVAASHDRFARAAVRAIRKWRFNVEVMDSVPATASQHIDFTLRR